MSEVERINCIGCMYFEGETTEGCACCENQSHYIAYKPETFEPNAHDDAGNPIQLGFRPPETKPEQGKVRVKCPYCLGLGKSDMTNFCNFCRNKGIIEAIPAEPLFTQAEVDLAIGKRVLEQCAECKTVPIDNILLVLCIIRDMDKDGFSHSLIMQHVQNQINEYQQKLKERK